ncbi:hypothetical protein OIU84_012196 [Salix udensis]|uniref:LysM domain-containing protein n=1 Tax=Salix udensis TaxID=889485 RepID=A0AAD6NSH7_9ROSI|nr:hypothetical protein OIU84_012196 [Salix udensis]
MNPKFGFGFLLLLLLCYSIESKCSKGCDLALASYYVQLGDTLTSIAKLMNSSILQSESIDFNTILSYNPQITNKDSIAALIRINIPFPCDCINGEFLGHFFTYTVTTGDTYDKVAANYSSLTTTPSLMRFNSYPET